MAREAQALTVAPRHLKPQNFGGSPTAWRALCEVYSSAETPEVIMAVVEYCTVRKLDPFKRPVHIVPMYNSKLRRKVQVVMQGINEIEITASRTGKWAGMDAAEWGPERERTFSGSFEDQNGNTTKTEVTLKFPEWCRVTVYRMVGETKAAFTEQLWWEETYGRAGFRSEVPNARWQQGRRQMLHKCTKAAVLRAAFPEDVGDYSAEEMEGHETDGGLIIDMEPEDGGRQATRPASGNGQPAGLNGPANETAAPTGRAQPLADAYVDRREADRAGREEERETLSKIYAEPEETDPGDARTEPMLPADQLFNEPDGRKWLLLLEHLSTEADSLDGLGEIATSLSVRTALEKAPTLIRDQINAVLRKAHERLAAVVEAEPDAIPDRIADPSLIRMNALIAEIETMDATTLALLPQNRAWLAKTNDLFPADADRLDQEIAERKRAIEAKDGERSTPPAS